VNESKIPLVAQSSVTTGLPKQEGDVDVHEPHSSTVLVTEPIVGGVLSSTVII